MKEKDNSIAADWQTVREPVYSDEATVRAYAGYALAQCQKRLSEDEEALDRLIDVPGKEAQAARMEARVISWEMLLTQYLSSTMIDELHESFHEALNDIAHVVQLHTPESEEREQAIRALGYIAPVFGLQQLEVRIEFTGGDHE